MVQFIILIVIVSTLTRAFVFGPRLSPERLTQVQLGHVLVQIIIGFKWVIIPVEGSTSREATNTSKRRSSSGFTLTTHRAVKKNRSWAKNTEQIPLGKALKQLLVKCAVESVSSTLGLVTSEQESEAQVLKRGCSAASLTSQIILQFQAFDRMWLFTLQNGKGVIVWSQNE